VILHAAWVVPVSAPPIRGGWVRITGDRIAAVGAAQDLAREVAAHPGREVLDLGDVILTPGLVNPHTHLELTCYAGQIAPGPFWSWLPQLVQLRAQPGQREREQQGVEAGAWESLRAGVTCVGDISRCNVHWPVLKRLPLRKVCFVELLTLADQPPRNVTELATAVAEVQEDDLLTVGISPHTPFTVPGDQVRAALTLADDLRRPWCTHWAETREECAFLLGQRTLHPFLDTLLTQCGLRSPGLPPIEHLERCCRRAAPAEGGGTDAEDGPPVRPGALAHYNYPAAGDAERLAAAGHVVMYCPRAHRFFQHTPHPYRALQRASVTVALGTDSAASNESLALLAECRFVARDTVDPPSPDVLLRMVTLDAAKALRLDERIGSLTVGKFADLAAFPCDAVTDDPAAMLVTQAPAACGVWVAGRRVF
jgi:cytosine/adenosine deaminase-related metal-dependent hydrolase